MSQLSIDLRQRIVDAYRSNSSGTYAETAAVFGVGEATVSRLLRLHRETGRVEPRTPKVTSRRIVDLAWLRAHVEAEPDARLVDRIDAWVAQGGRRCSETAMWFAVRACGFTHKKRPS
jgi:transposase